MIVERVTEYTIDNDAVAAAFHDEYQEFIIKNDNEDTWDFVAYVIERFGLEAILEEPGLAEASYSSERFI